MKKGLLATSALVGASLLGAPAMAAAPNVADNLKLTITGNLRTTIMIHSQDQAVTGMNADLSDGFQFRGAEESEIAFQASATAANGLGYGFQIEVQTQTDDTANADEAWMYIDSPTFGRIELGDQDDAADRMMIDGADAQAGRGGNNFSVTTGGAIRGTGLATIDSASITRAGDASKIIYFTPRFSGFQLGLSYTPDTGQDGGENAGTDGANTASTLADFADVFAFGVNYVNTFSGAKVTLAATYQFGENESILNEDLSIWGIGGQVVYSGFTFAAGYANSGDTMRTKVATAAGADGGSWWNVGLMYTTGPWDFSAGYFSGTADNGTLAKDSTATQFAVSTTYRMAPGWTLAGDVVWFSYEARGGGPITAPIIFTPASASETDGWMFVMSSTMTF